MVLEGSVRKQRVAVYCRVSTADQSLEAQETRCVDFCKREGHAFEVFAEKTSGAKENRTELDRLMQSIRHKEFDILCVAKLDRLGRSLPHLLQVLNELENNKVAFISLSEGFDTSTPQGRFFFQIAGSFAQFERSLISERTKETLKHLKAQGKHVGRPQGSKDKGKRRKSGYYARWMREKPSKQPTPLKPVAVVA